MRIPGKLYYAIFIVSMVSTQEVFCRQAKDCNNIMSRNGQSTTFIQQDFSDSSIRGSLRIELVAESNKAIRLSIFVEDYDDLSSEKDSLGLLNYTSPHELQDGMDVLFQFSGKKSRTFNGKQTLENLEPVYRQRLEEDLMLRVAPPLPLIRNT